MNYNSVEELKKIINENPVPNNFVSLSDGEKEKYYDIFRNIFISI